MISSIVNSQLCNYIIPQALCDTNDKRRIIIYNGLEDQQVPHDGMPQLKRVFKTQGGMELRAVGKKDAIAFNNEMISCAGMVVNMFG